MSFASLNLSAPLLRALADARHETPTPIQASAIPVVMAGFDVMASAKTGTGKTAAFILPALERLLVPDAARGRGPRVLVLSPTRELAGQIKDAAVGYARHLPQIRIGSIVGGVPYPAQQKLLARPLDILVATPGRLLDHIGQNRVDFTRLELVIFDEADRMLDMGFLHDVERIMAAAPAKRQTVMFSATFEGQVTALASRLLKDPKRIRISSNDARSEQIRQRIHFVDDSSEKKGVLLDLLTEGSVGQAIVFTSTKRGAERLAAVLDAEGHATSALHGDMRQGQRNRALSRFREGSLRILVATDIAARGIDVASISHVFNYDLPRSAEDYVHRIGRTGRAGQSGAAISFATHAERGAVRRIERLTGQPLECVGAAEPVRRAAPAQPVRSQRARPEDRRAPRTRNQAPQGRRLPQKRTGVAAEGTLPARRRRTPDAVFG